ncbi:MAG: sugar phosphate nucleotidyltransferase [Patescibacteria group bacterium]|nr:sugar phosphate nucleotidyltransferase [bacterium]MDZ4240730.1 sugar phosphate nucleotidyltransferase [Patescibacteria group bacterium]
MKGIILAGGLGTRLLPLTLVTNKHLLPVYDKPMIMYPIETLRKAGILEILLVCGREHAGHFINFLGSGKEYGVKLSYAVQDKNNAGIADALSYAEDFADKNNIAVILGDNIFEDDFTKSVQTFKSGVRIFFKKVKDPKRYGVPVFDKSGKRILKIEEKPKKPKSAYAQTGFWIMDNQVFSFIQKQTPSRRGELEMTDSINQYIRSGIVDFSIVKGGWYDAGTIDSLLESSLLISKRKK